MGKEDEAVRIVLLLFLEKWPDIRESDIEPLVREQALKLAVNENELELFVIRVKERIIRELTRQELLGNHRGSWEFTKSMTDPTRSVRHAAFMPVRNRREWQEDR